MQKKTILELKLLGNNVVLSVPEQLHVGECTEHCHRGDESIREMGAVISDPNLLGLLSILT